MNKLLFLLPLFSLSLASCIMIGKSKVETTDICKAGERTVSYAEVSDSIGGKTTFVLNENVCIETIPTEDPEWNEIAILVEVTTNELPKNEIIAGRFLIGKNGKEVGHMLLSQSVWEVNKENDKHYGFLRGYVKKSSIDRKTILEEIIADSCMKNTSYTVKHFEPVIEKYNFINYHLTSLIEELDYPKEEYSNLSGIVEFMVEDSWLSDPGSDRLSLVFRNDTLWGIVHKRELKISFGTEYALPGDRHLILLNDSLSDASKELLKFKTQFYNDLNE